MKRLGKFWPEILLLCAAGLMLFVLCGCSDEEVRAELAQKRSEIAKLEMFVGELRGLAEATGNEKIKATLLATETALSAAKDMIPQLEKAVEDAGNSPGWMGLLAAGWPVVMSLLRLIPGVGGVAAPVAEVLWAMTATKKQKDADASQS